jgi:hypothetical protein
VGTGSLRKAGLKPEAKRAAALMCRCSFLCLFWCAPIVNCMPTQLGRELASSHRLHNITLEASTNVGPWLNEQLTAPNPVVRQEAEALVAAHSGNVVSAAADLIGRLCEEASSLLSPSPTSRPTHAGSPHTPFSFNFVGRMARIALQETANCLVEDVKPNDAYEGRAGSKVMETFVLSLIEERHDSLVVAVNTAMELALSGGPTAIAVRVLSMGTNVHERAISSDRSFCDLWLRLELELPTFGISEVRDIPVNFKAVRAAEANKSLPAINSGGLGMLRWMMLGEAPDITHKRDDVTKAIAASFEEGSPPVPDTDYLLWVWFKPEATREVPPPRVISLLSVTPDELEFNDSQAWPAIQFCVDATYESARLGTETTCHEARKRMWDWLCKQEADTLVRRLGMLNHLPIDERRALVESVAQAHGVTITLD